MANYAEENLSSARVLLEASYLTPRSKTFSRQWKVSQRQFSSRKQLASQRTHSIRSLVNALMVLMFAHMSDDEADLLDSIYLPSR